VTKKWLFANSLPLSQPVSPYLQQPDFAQSGLRLQRTIDDLFCNSLKLAVLGETPDADSGMSLCFQEQMRGNW
jgi:hypothetical protein